MQDRQPGAPGQYKATVTAAELQKMQAGEQFTITMVRDDQPIVEGTPYSKAAVLPDTLAAIVCPDVLNPTPADAFAALLPRNGKAAMTSNLPMGGYKVTGLGSPTDSSDAVPLGYANGNFAPAEWGIGKLTAYSVTSDAEIDSVLISQIDSMGGQTFKRFVLSFTTTSNFTNAGGHYYTDIYKMSTNYAIITTKSYISGGRSLQRIWFEGTLYPWEWVNPPMKIGVEYRTTERCEGKAVYAKRISYTTSTTIGNASGLTDITIPHSIANFNYLVRAFGRKGDMLFPEVTASGGISSINQVNVSAINFRIYKDTFAAGVFYFDLYYTKTN